MPSEETVELHAGDLSIRVGLRAVTPHALAAGPIELEFVAAATGERPLFLLVGGDRTRRRPGGFTFEAEFGELVFHDPLAELPDFGGPAGVVEVGPGERHQQTLLLNDFLNLESMREVLAPDESGRLHLICRRSVPLASNEAELFASQTRTAVVEVPLAVDLHRDDEALVALVQDLLDQVVHGTASARERPLGMLLSLRAPLAVERWRALADHPDPTIGERARWALSRWALSR